MFKTVISILNEKSVLCICYLKSNIENLIVNDYQNLQNVLREHMDQTVFITVYGIVWMALHVTELPKSVILSAILGTLEYCVTQV